MKQIYFFGEGSAEGCAKDKNLLGGKGANLAEMIQIGIPVPPGITISTEVCKYYMQYNIFPSDLEDQIMCAIKKIEIIMNQQFNNNKNPLLVSVRSGARQSMPGMMETVLNIGLTTKTIPGLINHSKDEKFVYDAYRRLITMYADVVMEKAEEIEPKEGNSIREQLDNYLENYKLKKNIVNDSSLTKNDLFVLCKDYKSIIKTYFGKEFPDNAKTQLLESISAVFKSWNGKRAINYRNIEKIPHTWGTAVNVQAMVFGNMGNNSATGVAFTRNPSTGKKIFYGEWLSNAQGEDVVAGIRTPNPINIESRTNRKQDLLYLEKVMPDVYKELNSIKTKLEHHYQEMQDIEFTVQNKVLWMLQTRTGKRTGTAAIRIAIDMINEGLIDEKTALLRIKPEHIDEVMHPTLDKKAESRATHLTTGLPAGPGGASGQIVFSADEAELWKKSGKKIILVRNETSPEDIHGMYASEAILTVRGGMTSHAALVARGWGKCCVVGCSEINISTKEKILSIKGKILKEGDWLTLNGSSGKVYLEKIPLKKINLKTNKYFQSLMDIANKYKTLQVRTNAENPVDVKEAVNFGAEGIGLCRTEHMFFNPERISVMREMIVAKNINERRKAIMKLLPHQQNDFYKILKIMAPHPVTIRLLDPPLHEFLPNEKEQIIELAKKLKITEKNLTQRIKNLYEQNPMLGHRGCRLGISYPEITEMQTEAIFRATAQLISEGINIYPEIMIPLVGSVSEFINQKKVVCKIAKLIEKEKGIIIKYLIGTMIELPRACLVADKIGKEADFFSFGTNDLTQTTFGFSRDDVGTFLPEYITKNILKHDPFQSIDIEGVGQLVKIAVKKGRNKNNNLKIGICGEHGGDPNSIYFFHAINLNYISCSPYRIPIAFLTAAQAAINKELRTA